MTIMMKFLVAPMLLTWKDGAVHVLMRNAPGREAYELPEWAYEDTHETPQACLQGFLDVRVINQSRLYMEPLPIVTQKTTDGEWIARAPFLVLSPPDVLQLRDSEYTLVALDPVIEAFSAQPVGHTMLLSAKEKLTKLVGSTTACLNMLPTFFSNVEIKRIHNAVLGGEVNRMTLRKRYEDTGYVSPTGERIAVKSGRQPQEMMAMIEKVHVFGLTINAE